MVESEERPNKVLQGLRIVGFGLGYIVLSGGLIDFNKYLIHKGRFPHAMQLTCCHMIGSTILSLSFYMFAPSMYPGVERTRGKKLQVYKWLVPIGIFFAVMLYGSNRAYLYCSVSFLQFMKEWNASLVFLFSCLAGLQSMDRKRLVVIAWIILGGCLCISGEMNFALAGFIYQLVSQICECLRCTFAEIVLSGDLKLDPLSYVLLVAPICAVVLLVGSFITWETEVWTDFKAWWPLIIPNACLAFILNVWIALVIKETSAVGFIVTGVIKDVVLVVFSSLLFRDPITIRQWICFLITISGVFFWSFMKVMPEHPIVHGFGRLLCVPPSSAEKAPTESTALFAGEDKKV